MCLALAPSAFHISVTATMILMLRVITEPHGPCLEAGEIEPLVSCMLVLHLDWGGERRKLIAQDSYQL